MGVEKKLTFRLTVGDLDRYDRLTCYSISNLFQEIASLHAEELGVGYEVMKEKGLAWIVARNKITIVNSQNVSKVVTVHTWPHPNGRFDFERDYVMYNENNEVIANYGGNGVNVNTSANDDKAQWIPSPNLACNISNFMLE